MLYRIPIPQHLLLNTMGHSLIKFQIQEKNPLHSPESSYLETDHKTLSQNPTTQKNGGDPYSCQPPFESATRGSAGSTFRRGTQGIPDQHLSPVPGLQKRRYLDGFCFKTTLT